MFHLFVLAGIGAGLALGWTHGARLYGDVGALTGSVAGGYAGFLFGRLPELVALRFLCGSLALQTSEELRSCLRDPDNPVPNLVLLELQRRGEDVRQEWE